MDTVRFVSYGFGPIGSLIAKTALKKTGFEIVGAIDISKDLVGKDVGEVMGIGKLGVKIESDAEDVLKRSRPDVVFHATKSYLDAVYDQIVLSISMGSNLISTCETLVYPYYRYPEIASRLDRISKEKGVRVIGLGINPGFLMDVLPALLTAPCESIRRIEVTRVVDAGKRRRSFQAKIGLGLSKEAFDEKLSSGEITCHVGFSESILLMASMLNVKLDRVVERTEPILARDPIRSSNIFIDKGYVIGIIGYGLGYIGRDELIRLCMIAALGENDYDEIKIYGEPSISWRCTTGVPGDIATASIVINSVPNVLNARAGLLTVRDILPISCKSISMI